MYMGGGILKLVGSLYGRFGSLYGMFTKKIQYQT